MRDLHAEDARDSSDSDQSAASIRSISPDRKNLPKSRRKKERKQFGALAHDLGDLLGAAFTEAKAEASAADLALGMLTEV